MSLFCFLWTPLLYLLFRSLRPLPTGSGGVWALLLGSIVAIIQFFLGALIEPGGFGFSRWVSACVDIVSLPAVLPFLAYLLCRLLRVFPGPADFAGFALLWITPGAAIRALGWSAQNDPILLVLAPLLWTAIALGIPFFIRGLLSRRLVLIGPAILGIVTLPLCAATAWWAFYTEESDLGIAFLIITMLPLLLAGRSALLRGANWEAN